jgi:lambda family phage portal protein
VNPGLRTTRNKGKVTVLARLRSINDYDDAVIERQKLANLFTAFITRGLGSDIDVDPMTNLPLEFGSDGTPLAGLQPGLIQELDYGQDIKFANPPEAGTTYSDYMRTQHLGTSAAAGIPYEIFSGDIKEVSDRTLRVVINEFRRFAEQRQWHTIIPMFCQPVREWWTDAAVLAGLVTLAERNDVAMVEWAPHGWSYIHPVQDPQGKKLEVEAGFRSRSSVIGEKGDDPDTVDDERAADIEREKTLGNGKNLQFQRFL